MNEIDHQELENLIGQCDENSFHIVVVDFYAPWYGPCRDLAPRLEELSGSYSSDSVTFCKVNVDKVDIARDYGITTLPTILIFQKGEVKVRFSGGVSVGEIKVVLDHLLFMK